MQLTIKGILVAPYAKAERFQFIVKNEQNCLLRQACEQILGGKYKYFNIYNVSGKPLMKSIQLDSSMNSRTVILKIGKQFALRYGLDEQVFNQIKVEQALQLFQQKYGQNGKFIYEPLSQELPKMDSPWGCVIKLKKFLKAKIKPAQELPTKIKKIVQPQSKQNQKQQIVQSKGLHKKKQSKQKKRQQSVQAQDSQDKKKIQQKKTQSRIIQQPKQSPKTVPKVNQNKKQAKKKQIQEISERQDLIKQPAPIRMKEQLQEKVVQQKKQNKKGKKNKKQKKDNLFDNMEQRLQSSVAPKKKQIQTQKQKQPQQQIKIVSKVEVQQQIDLQKSKPTDTTEKEQQILLESKQQIRLEKSSQSMQNSRRMHVSSRVQQVKKIEEIVQNIIQFNYNIQSHIYKRKQKSSILLKELVQKISKDYAQVVANFQAFRSFQEFTSQKQTVAQKFIDKSSRMTLGQLLKYGPNEAIQFKRDYKGGAILN